MNKKLTWSFKTFLPACYNSILHAISRTPRFPRRGETVFGHSFTTGFGGKGINQCLAADRLGASTAFVGKVSP